MYEIQEKLNNIFKALCNSNNAIVVTNANYDQIMESNESRIDYLNKIFDKIENGDLNESCLNIFEENIDLLHDYINGNLSIEFSVPQKYFYDKEDNLIVPSQEQLDTLFEILGKNKKMYERLYKNKEFFIKLPDNSFNQNMVRILRVYEYNLAHLVGLVETEKVEDPTKNGLKKYFFFFFKDTAKYGEKISEKLFNWVLSEEGQEKIRELNKITIEFIEKDRKKNQNNYDEKGNIKSKSSKSFKKRFKMATGLDFPIIKFSRYITKSINNLNFLYMNNIFQMILDYNEREGTNYGKDIFLVNTPIELMINETKKYLKLNSKILDIIELCATKKELKDEVENILCELGINCKDKEIIDFINLIESYKFVGKHQINPNQSIALDKIRNVISKFFCRNIHLIGFGTDFDNQDIDLNKFTSNYSHCDTSISLTIADIIGDFYLNGRPFFLDKIYDGDGEIIRLSTPKEELSYRNLMLLLEPNNIEQIKKIDNLKNKLMDFEKKYINFKNSFGKGFKKN